MNKVAIIGKGNIGWAIKQMLKNDYEIKQGDITDGLDASNINNVRDFLVDVDASTSTRKSLTLFIFEASKPSVISPCLIS